MNKIERRALVYDNDQEKLVFLLYLALVIWLPIPLGSNRDWSWSLFEIICSLLTLWTMILIIGRRISVGGIVPYMKWVLLLFCLAIALQVFQIYPIGPEKISQLSPRHFELLDMLEPEQITLSIDKHASIQSILKQLSYLGLFFLSLVFLADRRRIRLVLFTIAAAGVFQAVLAISQWISLSSMNTGMENRLAVSGTFVSKNHFAAYLNMIVACIVGLLLFNIYLGNSPGAGSPRNIFSIRSILLVFLTVVVFAIAITQSRGAGVAFVITMLSMISLFSIKRIWRKKFGNNLLIFTLFSVGITLTLGHKIISDRFVSINEDITYRTEIWSLTEELIRDYPLFGIGSGNYSMLIPHYEQKNYGGFIDHAHNDYLEMLAEQGLVGFSIYGLIILLCFLYAMRIIFRSNDATILVTTGVGFFGVVTMLAHAMLDFNFYIPSNAAYFYIFLALMVTNAHHVKNQYQAHVIGQAKARNSVANIVSVVILMLTMLFFSTSASGNAGEAVFVLGAVEKTSRSGETVKLGKGMKVDEGDKIVTFEKGQAMLKMLDGSKISVRPGSSFEISAYSFAGKAKTDKSNYELIKGGFRSLTGTIGKVDKSNFRVKSPVASIGIRGTDFAAQYCDTECSDDSGLYVDVIKGGVSVTNSAGTINVEPGKFAHVQSANSSPAFVDKLPASMTIGRNNDEAGGKRTAPSHEEEIAAIALHNTNGLDEIAQVMRELVENEMPSRFIIQGALSVGIEPLTIVELLLELSPDKENVIRELLKAMPNMAGDILSIAVAMDYVGPEEMKDIATSAGVSRAIQQSALALGRLIAPPEDQKGEQGANSPQTISPGTTILKRSLTPPAQIIPSRGTGDAQSLSPS